MYMYRTRNISLNWLVEVFENGNMTLKYVPIVLQIADIFSKRFTKLAILGTFI